VGLPEGNILAGPGRRRVKMIKVDLGEIAWDLSDSVYESVEESCEHSNETLSSIKH
jgi:hypothetical protein